MGIGRFFKSEEQQQASAFDAIPDDVRQFIANDIVAIIECVKHWKVAILSDEHGNALAHEVKEILTSNGRKLVTAALMGGEDITFDWSSLVLPAAIKDIIGKVRSQIEETKPDVPVNNGSQT